MKSNQNRAFETILVIVAGLLAIYFIFKTSIVFVWVALGIAITAALIPAYAMLLHKTWSFIGKAMGYVVSPILLGLVYFVFLTPLAIIRRALRKKRGLPQSKWIVRNHLYSSSDLVEMW